MRIRCFRTRDFRNLAFVELALGEGARHYLHGPNGQGKTNLLEGLGLVSSLRSFRTRETRALLRREARPSEAQLYYEVETAREGASEVEIRLRPKGKQVVLDGEPLRRMADLLGRFPTLTLSSHDIEWLRGSPSLRRRFLDMLLAGIGG
ncbi:MAG: DNA replication and repair protein RecF, partial [Verrucomicrobia bacterium]|nr:DNA replication and repair protein RecF [Verrucomicrobiota bacterium]